MRYNDEALVRTQIWFSRTELLIINDTFENGDLHSFENGDLHSFPSDRRLKLFINRSVRETLRRLMDAKGIRDDEFENIKIMPDWLKKHREKNKKKGNEKRLQTWALKQEKTHESFKCTATGL